ncbi:MAG: hypothetical protein ACOYN0_09065 [Phycisphaerales bacterium]
MHTMLCCLIAGAAVVAGAQPEPKPQQPPQLRLGERVRQQLASWKPIGEVVIVTDAKSYVDAIASWTPARKFPVLIDLGDRASREHIARFVRAFKPARVARWTSDATADAKPRGVGEASFARCGPGELRSALGSALGMTTPPSDDAAIIARFKELNHTPAGIVLVGTGDPAWTAGLALAAGRAQPLSFIVASKSFGGAYNTDGAAAFAAGVESAAKSSGYSWDDIGDDLDAVTLALNVPVKFDPGNTKERLALTDLVGRHVDGPKAKQRWAWCGQIPGDAAAAAYRAMCSLFLEPRSAWVFDGYESTGDWAEYDGTKAGHTLKAGGLLVETMDAPAQSASDWRTRVSRPVSAGLVMITTKGNNNFFDLQPGQCRSGDIPMLDLPAAVHIVHSWSAQQPDDRSTIAGRWLERGAYAYFGSVDEPFLRAFVPTPLLAQRIVSGAPFFVAARLDSGPVWKTASIGDPLLTFGEVRASVDEPLPLKGAVELGGSLRELLTENKFAEAIGEMTLLGRDEDIVKLVRALEERQPARITPEVARAALLPAFRRSESRMVISLFRRLDAPARREGDLVDALWLAAYPMLKAKEPEVVELLAQQPRADQADRDKAATAAAR